MHEAGLTRRILEVVLERAATAGAQRVTGVHLEVGEESDVSPESVDFYWPDIARGSAAAGAQLYFTTVDDDPWACRVVAIDVDGDRPRHSPAGR
jgi:hydrogenase nickel incorporation protein HypA/HybF